MTQMPKYLKIEWALFLDDREIQRAVQKMGKELQAKLPSSSNRMPEISIKKKE